MNLDTKNWKYFRIDELFDLKNGRVNNASELEDGNDIPYVGAKKSDNGIMRYVKMENNKVSKGNCIVFITDGQGSVGYANYMDRDFLGTINVVCGYNKNLNELSGQFIATVFGLERPRYSWGRKLKNTLPSTVLKLPATPSGDPDWQWMEDYIKSLHSEPITTGCNDPKSLDSVSWSDFQVKELFNVKYGINMELKACTETRKDDPEAIAFVARTSENNGVSAFVKCEEGKTPQPAYTITVAGGGSVLSTFLQIRPFYSGRDLYLLIPKHEISNYGKLFIVTVLQVEKYRFNYGRQANKTLSDLNLHLPITSDGKPDWQFMEDYMKSLPYGDRIG